MAITKRHRGGIWCVAHRAIKRCFYSTIFLWVTETNEKKALDILMDFNPLLSSIFGLQKENIFKQKFIVCYLIQTLKKKMVNRFTNNNASDIPSSTVYNKWTEILLNSLRCYMIKFLKLQSMNFCKIQKKKKQWAEKITKQKFLALICESGFIFHSDFFWHLFFAFSFCLRSSLVAEQKPCHWIFSWWTHFHTQLILWWMMFFLIRSHFLCWLIV